MFVEYDAIKLPSGKRIFLFDSSLASNHGSSGLSIDVLDQPRRPRWIQLWHLLPCNLIIKSCIRDLMLNLECL